MYIGNDLQIAHPSYKIIDDISSGFNGSTTSFALQVSGATPVPFPISTQQVMISVNGVVQEPDPNGSAGFKLLGSNIVFSSAPANGHAFFGVINAGADYVTAGSEFPDGSATAPSFTFQDDQDTGWYRNASGDVGYSSNGTAILNFDGNGLTIAAGKGLTVDTSTLKVDAANNRVGIGLTAPATNFHVKAASPILRLEDSTDPQGTNGSIGKIEFYGNDGSSGGVDVRSYIQTISTNSTGNNHALVIGLGESNNAPTEKIRILGDGKVGIGTTSPAKALEVVNNTTPQFQVGMANDADRASLMHNGTNLYLDSTAGGLVFRGASNAERMRIDSNGRLLVGHTASIDQNAKIQAFTTSTDTFAGFKYGANSAPNIIRLGKSRNASIGGNTIVADDDEIGRIGFVGADGTDFNDCAAVHCFVDGTPGAGTDMPGRLVFSTTADGSGSLTERMRIDSSGRVGIGTTSPDAPLTIHNSSDPEIRFGYSGSQDHRIAWDSSKVVIHADPDNQNNNSAVSIAVDGTTALTLDDSQNASFAGSLTVNDGTPNITVYAETDGEDATLSLVGKTASGGIGQAGIARIIGSSEATANGSSHMKLQTRNSSNAMVTALTLDNSQNATFAATVSDSKGDLRKIPINAKSSSYTLISSDAGKTIRTTAGVTVPSGVFYEGEAITIFNDSGSNITITQGSNQTMYNAADAATGNRTLAGRGLATVLCFDNNEFVISGAGLS
jgi:hypothetical protein